MAALTQGNYLGDWLIAEFGAPNHCRVEATLAAGQNLKTGTVVATNGSGTWSAFVHDDATYGTCAGILLADVDATDGALPCVVIVRGPATISSAGLTWHADNDDTEKGVGLAALLALGIVAVEGV